MTLDIKGNTVQNPLNVVFVLDYSFTMSQEKLQTIIEEIQTSLETIEGYLADGTVRVSAVAYNREVYSMGLFSDNIHEVTSFFSNLPQATTGTFTQKGLYEAQRLFSQANPAAKNVLVHIGSGSANCSYLPEGGITPNNGEIASLNGYATTDYHTSFETSSNEYNTSLDVDDPSAIKGVDVETISSATLGTAATLKHDMEIVSIAISPSARGAYTALNLATGKAHYAAVDDGLQGLSDALVQVTKSANATISHGTVTDPLGDNVLQQTPSTLDLRTVG